MEYRCRTAPPPKHPSRAASASVRGLDEAEAARMIAEAARDDEPLAQRLTLRLDRHLAQAIDELQRTSHGDPPTRETVLAAMSPEALRRHLWRWRPADPSSARRILDEVSGDPTSRGLLQERMDSLIGPLTRTRSGSFEASLASLDNGKLSDRMAEIATRDTSLSPMARGWGQRAQRGEHLAALASEALAQIQATAAGTGPAADIARRADPSALRSCKADVDAWWATWRDLVAEAATLIPMADRVSFDVPMLRLLLGLIRGVLHQSSRSPLARAQALHDAYNGALCDRIVGTRALGDLGDEAVAGPALDLAGALTDRGFEQLAGQLSPAITRRWLAALDPAQRASREARRLAVHRVAAHAEQMQGADDDGGDDAIAELPGDHCASLLRAAVSAGIVDDAWLQQRIGHADPLGVASSVPASAGAATDYLTPIIPRGHLVFLGVSPDRRTAARVALSLGHRTRDGADEVLCIAGARLQRTTIQAIARADGTDHDVSHARPPW